MTRPVSPSRLSRAVAADDFPDEEEMLGAYGLRFPAAERQRLARRRHAFRDAFEGQHGRLISAVGEASEAEAYPMTYQPARFEGPWLRSSLRSFYDQELIADVLAAVKGGKEANVYRCRAHPHTGQELLAAKVYRPRQFRNLSNDRAYREGRLILTASGQPVRPTDDRTMRAIGKKTPFGVQVQHTSWLMWEYNTLERLHRTGGAVPEPLAANENCILMGYQGDERQAAPALQEVSLGKREAQALLREVLRNVELLLQQGLVHGDLSAYNILYWEGKITLIDFPQVTSVLSNRNAQAILERDVKRVCQYFARQGAPSDPAAIAARLWDRYGVREYDEPEI